MALALFVAALPADAARVEADTDSLKIGVLATLEGAFESLGQDALRGYRLAMEEHGERAGGRPIEAVVESTDGTPESVIAKALVLIAGGASVIIGPLAGIEGIAIRDFAKSVPAVTIINGASAAQDATLRAPAENFFRFNPDSMQWIAGLGRHAYDLKGIRTVVTVAEDYSLPYSQLMGFMLDYCALGGQVLATHWLSSSANDAARIARTVAGVETDALFLALAPHAAQGFLEAYGNAGGAAAIVASSTTLNSKLLLAENPVRTLLTGAISALPVSESDDNEALKALTQRYRERFPDAGSAPGLFALAYYVNTKALLLALEETGGVLGEGQRLLRTALAGLRFETPLGGPVSLDENRHAVTSNFIVEVSEASDGSLVQRTVQAVPEIDQALGLERAAFVSLGPPNRDSARCPEHVLPRAEARPLPSETAALPAPSETEAPPAPAEMEAPSAPAETETPPAAAETEAPSAPAETEAPPPAPQTDAALDTAVDHPLLKSEKDTAMTQPGPSIVSCLSYRDAPAAIAWLKEAFGFTENMIVPGPDGTIAHAQLAYGSGLVMLGSQREDGPAMRSPCDLGGITQSIYVVVEDADAHYARAVAAGAEIVRELEDTDYGSRDYAARDPEGHLWNFGTYRPEMGE